MTTTLNILFYVRRDKSKKEGVTPIYCRITVNGERATLTVQRSVELSKWDAAKGRMKGNTQDSRNTNAYISLIANKIYEAHYKLLDSGTGVTAMSLKRAATEDQVRKSKSLFKVFEDHNSKVKALIDTEYASGTYERYQTCLKHLQQFVYWKYGRSDYNLDEVNHEFVTEFDFFLRTERKCANNSTVKYLKNFRKIILSALNNSWIDEDPFTNFKMKVRKVDRGYLTKGELNIIQVKCLTVPRLDQVRDVFIFQCYTGLAYCDLRKLTKDNLFLDVDGVYWVKTRRTKTDTSVNIPLLPQALSILDKYKDHSIRSKQGYIFPVPSNQKLNSYLKEIADLCGIDKRLSSHLARHTFGTTVTLANGISLEAVSKMLGHTNLVTTKIYARMLDTRVADEMLILSNKFLGDKLGK